MCRHFQQYGASCGCDPNLSQQEYEGFDPYHTGYYPNTHLSYGDETNYHWNAHQSFGDDANCHSNAHQSFGDDANYHSNAHQSFGDDANYQGKTYHSFDDGTGFYGYSGFGQGFDGSAQPRYASYGHFYGYPQQYDPYASPYAVPPRQYAQQYSCSYQDFDRCGGGCCADDISSTGYCIPGYYDYLWPPAMVEAVENVEEFTMKWETRPMSRLKTRRQRKRAGGRRGREYYGSYGMGGCGMM